MSNVVLDHDHVVRRFPRLIHMMRWTALLTAGEAAAVVISLKNGDDYSCEAVAHYGGVNAVMRDSIRRRHVFRRLSTQQAA